MNFENLQNLIAPSFSESVLEEILQKTSGFEQVVINNIIIEDCNQTKGYSYLSSVIKFVVEGTAIDSHEEKKISCAVIVKTLPKNIGRRKSFRSTDFFRNEVIFYNEVWATLVKFQESKNIKNNFDNLPRCLKAIADGKNDYIALEDLSAQSYVHFKKEKEIDYECIIYIIKLFAKFHALSFAYKDQFPKEFDKLVNSIEETYFDEKFRTWYADFHKSLMAVSRDAIEKELPTSYLIKYDELMKNDPFGLLVKICKDKANKLSVITQGDAWIPNFLVKFDNDNNALDIKMIDFQLARCCSPSCDISFFLYTCASYEILKTRWDEIMKEYHSTFIAFLTELGSDSNLFKYEDFIADLNKNALLGYCMSMEALPFQLMDESETPDLDTIQGTEEVPITTVWKVYPIKNDSGRQKLANIFKHVVDRGFLEI